MYIPPFWCGVTATLLVELVATIVYAAVALKKDDSEEQPMSVSRKVKQRTMLAIGKDWIYVCGNETHVKIKNAKTGQTKTLVNRKKRRKRK